MRKGTIFGVALVAAAMAAPGVAQGELPSDEDPCDELVGLVCNICGDDSAACEAVRSDDTATRDECYEAMDALNSAGQSIMDEMGEEGMALFNEEFCRSLAEDSAGD